jgi:D-alanyl-D-alanine carboxypeptidase (penicillin-binding protein 5/6)
LPFLAQMLFSRRTWLSFLMIGLLPVAIEAASTKRAAPTRPDQAADNATAFKGAIVMDAASGKILFEDRADYVGPPASVTKLMTFLLVQDRLTRGDISLQTPVQVTAEAAKTGGSQVYLAEKEVFSVEELLYALMIASANDAATALAIHLTGSRSAFVELMNSRARELGLTNTTFRSPHGLPPSSRQLAESDLTSPRDLARLSVHLLKTTDILKYTSVKLRTFRPGPKQIDMVNHNHLLGKVAGVDGLKTGFTRGAGFCLAATALRHGRRILVVTMGSPDSKTRDIKIAELLERGFSALPAAVPFQPPAASPIAPAPRTTSPVAAPPPAPAPASAAEPVIKFSIPKK